MNNTSPQLSIPETSPQDTAPQAPIITPSVAPVSPRHPRHTTILNIILVFLVLAGVGAIAYLSYSHKSSVSLDSKNKSYITGTELEQRKVISDKAFEITSEDSISDSVFVDAINPLLDANEDESLTKSLNIYATFIAARHGLSNIAIGQYKYYIHTALTDKQKCELREYRKAMEGIYDETGYSSEDNEAERQEYCDVALEDYPQKEDESSFSYAERLYYEGFLTKAIELFEQLDPDTLNDENYNNYYNYILSYYRANGQNEKYFNIESGITE